MKLKEVKKILPPKIIGDLKDSFKEFKLTKAQKKKAIELAVDMYKNSCYEPGEAVGVVAAQSISEPATQMSQDFNEKLIIKYDNEIKIVKIGEFVDGIVNKLGFKRINGSEVCDLPNDINCFVLSLNWDEKIKWKKIKSCIRHKSPEKMLKIITKSGRSNIFTDHHSFVIRKNNKIVPIAGKKLKIGDRIPTIKYLPENCIDSLDINDVISLSGYYVKDGFVHSVYPQFKSIPENINLNELFGWFVGAYLSEGNATKNYISISNTNENFLSNARSFAESLDINYRERDYKGEFGPSHSFIIDSSLLSNIFLTTCDTGSDNKKVPEFAYSSGEEFVSGLLRGYFDGNGNISVNRKMIRVHSNSEDLIDGIKLLLTRFSIFAHKCREKKQFYLLIPYKYAPLFLSKIGSDIKEKKERLERLAKLAKKFWNTKSQDFTDMINGFGDILYRTAKKLKYPTRYVNNFTKRQKIGRTTLYRYIKLFEKLAKEKNIDIESELKTLKQMFNSDVIWDEIVEISHVKPSSDYVYDISVDGLETFTTFDGIITHNTMRTYHLAGASEIKVTLGLPRLIEIFDARRTPKTPTMTIYLKKNYNTAEKAYKVASEIQETQLKDISTEPAVDILNMRIEIPLDFDEIKERGVKISQVIKALKESRTFKNLKIKATKKRFLIKPKEEMSIKKLQKLKTKILKIRVKGVKGVSEVRVVKRNGEWVINTLGSNLPKVLDIVGVDAKRAISNNIHEVYKAFGIEAARQAIVNFAMDTMKEGGLDVDIRHIMLVADVMTADGKIKAIGRYGVAGSKGSVLARANFEETIKHLTKAAINAEVDTLDSIIENVIINQVVPVGTGMFRLVFKPKK